MAHPRGSSPRSRSRPFLSLAYSLQNELGARSVSAPDSFVLFHQEVHGSWIAMELATIAVGLVALVPVRAPLILAPVCFVAWYFAMGLAPAVSGGT